MTSSRATVVTFFFVILDSKTTNVLLFMAIVNSQLKVIHEEFTFTSKSYLNFEYGYRYEYVRLFITLKPRRSWVIHICCGIVHSMICPTSCCNRCKKRTAHHSVVAHFQALKRKLAFWVFTVSIEKK